MKAKLAAVIATILMVGPITAQEKPDTTTYKSAPVPVWIVVENVSKGESGAHRVSATILWDDSPKLRFGDKVLAGDLVVSLAAVDAKDATKICTFTSTDIAHGSQGYQPLGRDDEKCHALGAENLSTIGVTHLGAPMVCLQFRRGNDPGGFRRFGCYWSEKPDTGCTSTVIT